MLRKVGGSPKEWPLEKNAHSESAYDARNRIQGPVGPSCFHSCNSFESSKALRPMVCTVTRLQNVHRLY